MKAETFGDNKKKRSTVESDPRMNHPHVKGGGTLFMQAHIHEDLELQPGMKFCEEKT